MKREETVLEVVSNCIRAEHLNQLSALVGQSPAVVGPALAKLLPLVVTTLAEQVSRPHGVNFLWDLTQQAQATQVLTQLDAMDIASWRGRGVLLLQDSLKDTYETTIQLLATKAGLPSTSYGPLVEVAVAAVLGALGKYTAEHNLKPVELSDWLQTQSVAGSSSRSKSKPKATTSQPATSRRKTPVKPTVAPTFATRAGNWQEVGGGSIFTPQQAAPVTKGNKRQLWLWPLLLVLGLALGYGFFRWNNTPRSVASTEPATPVKRTATTTQPNVAAATAEGAAATTKVPAGQYDSATDTYIYHTGQPLVVTLFNGSTLNVGANSTEYQLYRFLADPTQQVDPLNAAAGWINVDRVYFNSGQATLTAKSGEQLRNLAAILRTFPRAQLLFGGYTDNRSSGPENLRLSEARAQSAMRALIAQGISPRRLQAVGYGEVAPVASNNTPVGRALNRRLVIKVISELGPLLSAPAVAEQAAVPLPAAAGATVTPSTKPLPSQDTANQPTQQPTVGEEVASSEVPVEPATEQVEADSRYRVAVRTAYLFDAPNQVQPTKKYLRKGDILYGEDERNGLVKIRFWNPNGALATGWLKLRELKKLSEDEATDLDQTDSEPDSMEAKPAEADNSASAVPAPGARAKPTSNGSATAVVRVAKSYFFNSPDLNHPEPRKAHCVRGDKVRLGKDGGAAVYVTFTNWQNVTTTGWMRKDALDYK
ncbi:OmpA family protein [uncultured Hymenobacter sp.]|uniref:OmpA family protein n=1 Tax=uncultured Hymenobacter sp. TaxID=170016 RepID=UPI0035CC492A